jgi:hypothetical protein
MKKRGKTSLFLRLKQETVFKTLHSVPDFTLCAKNLPSATFINAQTFTGSSPTHKKQKRNQLNS